jgi:hypothetical protein
MGREECDRWLEIGDWWEAVGCACAYGENGEDRAACGA